ncbi:hypothetical protein GGS23DRAFT_595978 [Durotheca rogersii]|uniref:uncharacterized protein n=1 Tax=Durotheca rogersii TaxID=419775 RepID=UPI00222051B4|nr:uncharacterized protein GGS23DRAFT_595978 [Durotheca rogersii]KAI5864345.1 hypothetical protein GGS23DRAFT_595978 [Durotheca rogersii]
MASGDRVTHRAPVNDDDSDAIELVPASEFGQGDAAESQSQAQDQPAQAQGQPVRARLLAGIASVLGGVKAQLIPAITDSQRPDHPKTNVTSLTISPTESTIAMAPGSFLGMTGSTSSSIFPTQEIVTPISAIQRQPRCGPATVTATNGAEIGVSSTAGGSPTDPLIVTVTVTCVVTPPGTDLFCGPGGHASSASSITALTGPQPPMSSYTPAVTSSISPNGSQPATSSMVSAPVLQSSSSAISARTTVTDDAVPEMYCANPFRSHIWTPCHEGGVTAPGTDAWSSPGFSIQQMNPFSVAVRAVRSLRVIVSSLFVEVDLFSQWSKLAEPLEDDEVVRDAPDIDTIDKMTIVRQGDEGQKNEL